MVVQGRHPLRIALGQIVVDRHQMRPLAFERVEIQGQRGHKSFAFARLHLGDVALMQNDAADQLHVEMAHA